MTDWLIKIGLMFRCSAVFSLCRVLTDRQTDMIHCNCRSRVVNKPFTIVCIASSQTFPTALQSSSPSDYHTHYNRGLLCLLLETWYNIETTPASQQISNGQARVGTMRSSIQSWLASLGLPSTAPERSVGCTTCHRLPVPEQHSP